MASWGKVLPDFDVVRWDSTNFDVSCNAFVSEAYAARKWAFVADYARLFALYAYGGIYLDTDVAVLKRFDDFLPYHFFTAVEYHAKVVRQHGTLDLLNADGSTDYPSVPKHGIAIQSAVIAGVRGHPFFNDCLEYYDNKHFVLDENNCFDKIIAPDVFAMAAVKYGFRYKNERQLLHENMLVLPSETFAGDKKQATSNSYAVHYCAGSWRATSKLGQWARRARARISRGH
jgi:hypothetical protein